MRYLRGLQVQLQERCRQTAKTGSDGYRRQLGYLLAFFERTPALKAILDVIERAEPELDPQVWVDENFGHQGYDWPPTEIGRAKVALHLVRRMADDLDPFHIGMSITNEGNLDVIVREITSVVVEPLIDFVQQHLGTESEILYLLDRYRRRVEWFEKDRLLATYLEDTTRGEAAYDKDLRQFLFSEGVDYPFSQAASASGRADVLAGLEGDDPLVCDVKLFDGESRGIAYLSAGVRQVVQYATDYGKTAGHLVIINLSGEDLELPSDGEPGAWPPRIHAAGITVYLIPIRARVTATASKLGPAAPIRVAREDLVRDLG